MFIPGGVGVGGGSCYVYGMDTPTLLARLKAMEPELRRSGVGALYLFGSRARGDHRDDSDVDLLFEVTPEVNGRFSLWDKAGLLGLLSDELQSKVDFVERRALLPAFRPFVEPDLVQIF